MKKIEKCMYILSALLFFIIFFIISLSNKKAIVLVLGLIFIHFFIKKKVSIKVPSIMKKVFPIILFIISFILRYTFLNILKIEPISDFAVLLNAALNLQKGINVMLNDIYFIRWGYQSGYVLYQTLILNIFNSVQAIHILDCFYTSSICCLIYYVGKRIFKKETIVIPSILYTIYIFGILYTGVLSNQHLFTFLSLIAILILTSDNEKIKYWKYIFVAVILALANIIRPESIILVCGIIGYEFFKITKKEDIKLFLKNIAILICVYLIITQSVSLIIKNSGINSVGLKNTNMLWKFVCGFDIESNGGYSNRGEAVISDREQELTFIKENLKELCSFKIFGFIKNKIQIFWANEAYDWVLGSAEGNVYNFGNAQISGQFIIKCINIIDKTFYIYIFAFSLLSIICGIKKNNNKEKNLLIIILDITAIIYLLVEVQPRYAYTAKVILFILAADGINNFNNMINYKKIKLLKENCNNEKN